MTSFSWLYFFWFETRFGQCAYNILCLTLLLLTDVMFEIRNSLFGVCEITFTGCFLAYVIVEPTLSNFGLYKNILEEYSLIPRFLL